MKENIYKKDVRDRIEDAKTYLVATMYFLSIIGLAVYNKKPIEKSVVEGKNVLYNFVLGLT